MIQSGAFRILSCFNQTEAMGFADLCKQAGYPTDLGGYYIRQLVRSGYLEKLERGQYRILAAGKYEIATRNDKRIRARNPRVMVLVVARQGNNLLVMRRKVQPFPGVAEWPAGSVSGGEEFPHAASRVLKIRTGLEAEVRMVGFFRRIDMYEANLFDDKLFAVFTCSLPEGELTFPDADVGSIELVARSDIDNLDKPSRALFDILHYTEAGQPEYEERVYHLGASDLSLSKED